MIGSIFAQHAPLIRNYPSAPPPPPAPPAPPTPLQPPQAQPIAFSAVTRASLFGVIGSAISSTTLATITCADASMTIVQSEAVAGLTISYTAGVLSIAGTATGSTRVQRVVVSYIASDGSNTVRGSTSHEITLVKASEVLTIGSMSGAAGRVGRPLSVTLASPSANYLVGVTAHPGIAVPGCATTLAWTEASPTSSGTLTLAGTPTLAGTYSLTVNYRNGAIDLGTSTHAVVIAAAYEAPAPAPAPTPAPPAPSPSPPPAPTPAPAPGLGPDPFISAVKVLMHFDTATGLTADVKGNTFTNYGATSAAGAVAEGLNLAVYEPTYATVATALGLVPGCDGADGYLAVDCMVDIDAAAWTALNAVGSEERYCPVVSYLNSDNREVIRTREVIWTIGFASWLVSLNGVATRTVIPIGYAALKSASGQSRPFKRVLTLSNATPGGGMTRPAKFVHLCMARAAIPAAPTAFAQASWFGGRGNYANETETISNLVAAPTGRVQIGGYLPAMQPLIYAGPGPAIVPFTGVVDEVRITANGVNRYGSTTLTSGADLSAPLRVIPWPN